MARPIIFSAPMVRAILEGRKTQTRRVITRRVGPPRTGDLLSPDQRTWFPPRYSVGDRLWVREAWRTFVSLDATSPRDLLCIPDGPRRGAGVKFESDGSHMALSACDERFFDTGHAHDTRAWGKLRPSIFLPRWGSRLTLAVTDVRVQRLQEISGEDAVAEGITVNPGPWSIRHFSELWEHIHGPDAWAANPWVVAITFNVIRANIDAISLQEAA